MGKTMKEKFKLKLDKIDDVIWLVLKTGPIEYYDEVEPGINLEFEDNDSLMGTEILHASKFLSFTKKSKHSKVYYEPEDDVLNIWISKKPYDFARQYENFIIHFSKEKKPVYIEILNYSKHLKLSKRKLSSNPVKNDDNSTVSIPHRI